MPVEFFGLQYNYPSQNTSQTGKEPIPNRVSDRKICRRKAQVPAGGVKTMTVSAARQLKQCCFNLYNKKSIAALTVEKLSGFGVSCNKSAVHLSSETQEVNCIFVAENSKINNNPLTI